MKNVIAFILFIALALFPAAAEPARGRLVFLGNSGWLAVMGGRKVLIDAPFTVGAQWGLLVPDRELVDKMAAGQPPFDRLDLVLVSHNHEDHVDAQALLACLAANPGAALVAPPAVLRRLEGAAGGRSPANKVLDPALARGTRTVLDVNGVRLEVFAGSHHQPDRDGMIHYTYLIGAGGRTLLHASAWNGDRPEEIDRARWADGAGVDAALLHYFMFDTNPWDGNESPDKLRERRRAIHDLFRPRMLILHHVYDHGKNVTRLRGTAGQLKADFPRTVVPEKLLEEIPF